MNARQRVILRAIERNSTLGGITADDLTRLLPNGDIDNIAVPVSSVRRAIRDLRRQGYNISRADAKTGVYIVRHGYPYQSCPHKETASVEDVD